MHMCNFSLLFDIYFHVKFFFSKCSIVNKKLYYLHRLLEILIIRRKLFLSFYSRGKILFAHKASISGFEKTRFIFAVCKLMVALQRGLALFCIDDWDRLLLSGTLTRLFCTLLLYVLDTIQDTASLIFDAPISGLDLSCNSMRVRFSLHWDLSWICIESMIELAFCERRASICSWIYQILTIKCRRRTEGYIGESFSKSNISRSKKIET